MLVTPKESKFWFVWGPGKCAKFMPISMKL